MYFTICRYLHIKFNVVHSPVIFAQTGILLILVRVHDMVIGAVQDKAAFTG